MRKARAAFQVRCRRLQHNDQPLGLRGRIEPPVRLVFRFASEIKLGYQAVEPTFDCEMNVRWPDFALCRQIPTRFDCTKLIASGRVRGEVREAFEIRIKRGRVRVAGMTIFARCVGLPDLNSRMRDWRPRSGKHMPLTQMRSPRAIAALPLGRARSAARPGSCATG